MSSEPLLNSDPAPGTRVLTLNRPEARNALSVEWGLIVERRSYGALLSTQDFREGVAAFREKRKPKFSGS